MIPIKLRAACLADCYQIYAWRNSPEIRQNCIDSTEIKYERHQEWFQAVLVKENVHLLIAELEEGEPLGTVRFDIKEELAEISIYLAPTYIGKGYGALILTEGEKWLKENCSHIQLLEAKILCENTRSQKLFTKLGFQPYLYLFRKELKNG